MLSPFEIMSNPRIPTVLYALMFLLVVIGIIIGTIVWLVVGIIIVLPFVLFTSHNYRKTFMDTHPNISNLYNEYYNNNFMLL